MQTDHAKIDDVFSNSHDEGGFEDPLAPTKLTREAQEVWPQNIQIPSDPAESESSESDLAAQEQETNIPRNKTSKDKKSDEDSSWGLSSGFGEPLPSADDEIAQVNDETEKEEGQTKTDPEPEQDSEPTSPSDHEMVAGLESGQSLTPAEQPEHEPGAQSSQSPVVTNSGERNEADHEASAAIYTPAPAATVESTEKTVYFRLAQEKTEIEFKALQDPSFSPRSKNLLRRIDNALQLVRELIVDRKTLDEAEAEASLLDQEILDQINGQLQEQEVEADEKSEPLDNETRLGEGLAPLAVSIDEPLRLKLFKARILKDIHNLISLR